MNARHFRHTVNVKRTTRSTNATTGVETPTVSQVLGGVKCLVEPLSTRQIESVVGRNIQAQLRISWGTDDIRDGDIIVFESRSYIVREVQSDTLRSRLRYQTAVLVESLRHQS